MPLANIHHLLIYSLSFTALLAGWLCSTALTHTYSIIYYGNINLDLCSVSQEHN